MSIEIKRGEVVGLLGPNGAGKTTSFYMITGMIHPSSGDVFFDDQKITNIPMYKRARMGMGYLAQEPSIFTKLSVEDNLRLVLQMTTLTKDQQGEKLEELLKEFSTMFGVFDYFSDLAHDNSIEEKSYEDLILDSLGRI